jgi:hypothetical protein
MDELSTVQQLLAEPPPEPDVVEAARLRLARVAQGRTPLRTRAVARGWHLPGLVRHRGVPRHWPGWLAPVAAAAAVAGVILASLAVSGVLLRPGSGGQANSAGAFAKVPRYLVALAPARGPAVVAATATGAVLGTVAPPKPHTVFAWVAAAGDDRTFVFAAGLPPKPGTSAFDWGPISFYRLVLSRSGRPGPLVHLPIPPETATLSGLAVSPDGSKFAVSLLGPANLQIGSKIQVFSLAAGAGRQWVWPGKGWIGQIPLGVGRAGEMSWAANNRTLLFEESTGIKGGWTIQLRLLDTATPGGSLLASSTHLPISSGELNGHPAATHLPFRIPGIPLITADGARLVTPAFRNAAPPKVFDFMITELSVHTGKPVRVLYQRRTAFEGDSPAVLWVNTTGTAMIAYRTRPGQSSHVRGGVLGVQTRTTFTPLPPATQHLIFHNGLYSRLPAW